MFIKAMETREEIIGKAFVHWKAWQEAYAELLPPDFLETVCTLESCQDLAFRYPQNTLIALVDNQVVGFACYGPSSQKDLEEAGELYAIYILADYYGQGIGYQLVKAALEQMKNYDIISLWVLKGNDRALSFYNKIGFKCDGITKTVTLGAEQTEQRMILRKEEFSKILLFSK